MAKAGWKALRILRLVLWLAAIGYYGWFMLTRADHLDSFGHLLRTTEFWMFMLPLAAIFVGFLELMMRERAQLPRPAFGRNWN